MPEMNNRRIAELAGVSPATVSKVFSGSCEISEETAARILRIAKENGWTPPKYRRTAISRAKSQYRIAILIPELISAYYAHIATVATEILRARGMEPDLHISGFTQDSFDAVIDALHADGVTDGILCLYDSDKLILRDFDIPIIFYYHSKTDHDTEIVQQLDTMISHLTILGHKNIAYIGERYTMIKLRAFQHVMTQQKLPVAPEQIFVSEKRFEEIGYEAAKWYLYQSQYDPSFSFPTAFVCAYDEIALGAMYMLQSAGLVIPNDISIIGMNNIAQSAYANVPLTTLHVFLDEQIASALDCLVNKIAKTPTEAPSDHRPYELIVRASTASPRKEASISISKSFKSHHMQTGGLS